MATHSSILAWRIPMDRGAWWAIVHGLQRVRHDWATQHSTVVHVHVDTFLDFLLHWFMCPFTSTTLGNCVSHEIRYCKLVNSVLSQNYFALLVPLTFCVYFRIGLTSIVRDPWIQTLKTVCNAYSTCFLRIICLKVLTLVIKSCLILWAWWTLACYWGCQ